MADASDTARPRKRATKKSAKNPLISPEPSKDEGNVVRFDPAWSHAAQTAQARTAIRAAVRVQQQETFPTAAVSPQQPKAAGGVILWPEKALEAWMRRQVDRHFAEAISPSAKPPRKANSRKFSPGGPHCPRCGGGGAA